MKIRAAYINQKEKNSSQTSTIQHANPLFRDTLKLFPKEEKKNQQNCPPFSSRNESAV